MRFSLIASCGKCYGIGNTDMTIEKLKEILANKITTLNGLILTAEQSGDLERYTVLTTELEETQLTLNNLSKAE